MNEEWIKCIYIFRSKTAFSSLKWRECLLGKIGNQYDDINNDLFLVLTTSTMICFQFCQHQRQNCFGRCWSFLGESFSTFIRVCSNTILNLSTLWLVLQIIEKLHDEIDIIWFYKFLRQRPPYQIIVRFIINWFGKPD